MAMNGLSTMATSPLGAEDFGSQIMGSSINSLSSSATSRPTQSHISKSYRQASQLFLTRRLPEAMSTVLPLITPLPTSETEGKNTETGPASIANASRSTRIKVWSLYLTILNAILELDQHEGKDAFGAQEWRVLCNKVRDGQIWEEVVVNGYHGLEGEVDADVVINLATLLLAHARTQELNQRRLENYLAASQVPNLDISQRLAQSPRLHSRSRRSLSRSGAKSGADTPRDLNARVKILELYTLHVLLRNDEWGYAREFINASTLLDEERKDAFLQALQSLWEDKEEQGRREREEQQRQEDQLQREIEESRRQRAENEARERRRLDEERMKRQSNSVDYGVEQTRFGVEESWSANGSGKPRPNGSSSITRPRSPRSPKSVKVPKSALSKPKGTTVPPSFATQAAKVMRNIGALIEQMAGSLQMNPAILMRLIAFIIGLIIMFGNRKIRERVFSILGSGWGKIKATAGMGVKVSYI